MHRNAHLCWCNFEARNRAWESGHNFEDSGKQSPKLKTQTGRATTWADHIYRWEQDGDGSSSRRKSLKIVENSSLKYYILPADNRWKIRLQAGSTYDSDLRYPLICSRPLRSGRSASGKSNWLWAKFNPLGSRASFAVQLPSARGYVF